MTKLIIHASNDIKDLIGKGTEILLDANGDPIALFIEGNLTTGNTKVSAKELEIDTIAA